MIELRASSLGSCTRAQAASLLGMKPVPVSDQMQALYDRGNEHETAAVEVMTASGHEVTEQQREVQLAVSPDLVVTGHLDGVVALFDVLYLGRRVLEIKAPSTWASFQTAYKRADYTQPYMHRIAVQVSVYMHAMGMEAILACVDDDGLHYFGIEVPPFDLAYIEGIARDVERQVLTGKLDDRCTQVDYPCPYLYLHDAREEEQDEALDALAVEMEACRADVKAAEARYANMQMRIRRALADRTSVRTASYTVTVYDQTTRRLDEKAMLADGLDIEKYRVATTSSRLKVTPRSKADDEGA